MNKDMGAIQEIRKTRELEASGYITVEEMNATIEAIKVAAKNA